MFQYYEMSYGLNIEMHKQVSELHVFLSASPHVSQPSRLTLLKLCIILLIYSSLLLLFCPQSALLRTTNNFQESLSLSLCFCLSHSLSTTVPSVLPLMDLYGSVMLWRR